MPAANPMMKCGHRSNATDASGNPVCVICIGIEPGACTIDDNPPDLSNRTAKCCYCSHTAPSTTPHLAFFEHQPQQAHDSFYCGCKGWE